MKAKTIAEMLNQFLWLNLTSSEAIKREADKNINELLSEINDVNFLMLGSTDKRFSFAENIIIEKLSAIYLDIMVGDISIISEIEEYGEEAEIDSYESIIDDSIDSLIKIRKAHPDGIQFVFEREDNICIKYSPYFFISNLIANKLGILL